MRIRTALMVVVMAGAVVLPPLAGAACPASLVIDDFASGTSQATLTGVSDTGNVVQTGTMLGGRRLTDFRISANTFSQPATLDIDPKFVALIVDTGVRVFHRLEVYYGLDVQKGQVIATPLHQDLSCFSKFRVHFDASSVGLNFNMQVVAGNNPVRAQCGVNQPGNATGLPFTVEFPRFPRISW